METFEETDLFDRYRRTDGNHRLDMGYLASGYQEDMDQFHGIGQQRLLFLADGIIPFFEFLRQ